MSGVLYSQIIYKSVNLKECFMSSEVDWTKGLRITGEKMDQDLIEKAERVRQFMKEETNNRKSGKSNTGKMALVLANRYLDDLESERDEKREELAKYLQKVDRIMEELN